MTASIEPEEISTGSCASSKAVRLSLIFVVLCALQIVLYLPTFHIQPYADDFSVSTELQRGREQGTWALFRQSNVDNYYRPFRSVIMYWMGSLPGASPVFWIHVSNAIAMLALAAVTCLWLCTIPVSVRAAVVGALVLLLHPALPQSYASVDSVDSIFSTAFLWLGAWVVYRIPKHPLRAGLIASALFLLGAGFKEYVFAMVPLATLAAWWMGGKVRWKNALIIFAMLMASFGIVMVIRQLTIPQGTGRGMSYVRLTPKQISENLVLLMTALLFAGNSVWVFVRRDALAFACVAGLMLAAVGTIAMGCIALWRKRPATAAHDSAPSHPTIEPRRCIGFFLLSLIAASFPINVMFHVSEMYLPPMIVSLAMLAALSVDGWRTLRPPMRIFGAVVAIGLFVTCIVTIRAKLAGMVDAGDRADRQLDTILSYVPPDASNMSIATVFLKSDIDPRGTYAVYHVGDEVLAHSTSALTWRRPGRGLTLETLRVDDVSDVDLGEYDIALVWDSGTRQLMPLKVRLPS